MPLYICPVCKSIMEAETNKCNSCASETVKSDSISWNVIGHVELFSTPDGFPEKYHIYLLESSIRRIFCFSESYYNVSAALYPDMKEGKIICLPAQEK
jgi:hypothetical protein